MGGIERYTSYLAKGLMAEGNRVLVVTTNPGYLPNYERMDGVPVVRLPAIPLIDGRFPVPKLNKEFFQLHKKLLRLSPDVVLVNARFYFHSLYGILFGRGQKARTLVLDHGSGHLSVHNKLFDTLGGWFEHGLTALEKCFCHEFYGVSHASVNWLSHFHIRAKDTLPNAVDLNAIEERLAHPKIDFRRKYGIPKDASVLVYTGRLLEEKGLLPLKEAFDRLCKKRDDVYLLIAGDGPLEKELGCSRNSHMRLTGRLDAGEITDLLGSSDIFCLPSVSEGFSTSMLEAAACRNYVMITESSCPYELLKDSTYASILPDARPETIFHALETALNNKEQTKEAAQKVYEELKAHFTWDKTVEKLEKLMDIQS